jgi:hypothetical protein
MEKIYTKLSAIQSALKAPKSQYNEFGRYKYRKAEDILEAVKPLLSANGCALTCTDELILVGDRYYIKATAIITCTEDGSSVQTTAFAREEAEKKGMDGSQVTGASSSYARKYALNGLLCIDDTADSDTTNVGETKPEKNSGRKPVQKVAEPNPAPEKSSGISEMMPGGRTYNAIVAAHAQGKKAKSGADYRTAWAQQVNANAEMLAAFDNDVAAYRQANNITTES